MSRRASITRAFPNVVPAAIASIRAHQKTRSAALSDTSSSGADDDGVDELLEKDEEIAEKFEMPLIVALTEMPFEAIEGIAILKSNTTINSFAWCGLKFLGLILTRGGDNGLFHKAEQIRIPTHM